MNKLLVICGPTATGKTKLGIKLAKKFSGEIVSADSRQVYKGMDIGTGKDVGNVKFQISNVKSISNDKFQIGYYKVRGVKVWLLDVVEPNEEFSVADYCQLAWKVVEDIWQRGKTPFLVGGTGFYIKAVIEGIESLGIPSDWELRKRLGDKNIKTLRKELREIDPKRWEKMNESDRENPRRLIRAIEIASHRKKQTLHLKPYTPASLAGGLNPFLIGLTAPYKILYQRIDKRVEERVKMGVEQEVKKLLAQGYSWDLPSMSGHGYHEWQLYFEGKQSRKETIQRWKYDEHGYALRQMTWFRKDPRIYWFDITSKGWENEVEKIVSSWYTGGKDAKKN